MRNALLASALTLLSAPAFGQTYVVHSFDSRFGVGYAHDPNAAQSSLQPLYQGRYTASFRHTSDVGVLFRFDLGVTFGNLPDRPLNDRDNFGEPLPVSQN